MTQPAKPPPAQAPVVPDDWPAQAADRIEGLVGDVRDKTTGPVLTFSRWLVYGFLIVVVVIALLILATTLFIRLLNSYLPFGDANVWASYLILGAITSIGGMVLLRRARTPAEPVEK